MAFEAFEKLAGSRWRFGMFMFLKLPSAFLCGVRLRQISTQKAVVSVPYKWLSQNPFRSIYFACQAMAAEMSTGVLVMGHIYERKPPVSMLVTHISGSFHKKASERVYFSCEQGADVQLAVEEAIQTGEGRTVTLTSLGHNSAGELVSSFEVTWSFKPKTSRVA